VFIGLGVAEAASGYNSNAFMRGDCYRAKSREGGRHHAFGRTSGFILWSGFYGGGGAETEARPREGALEDTLPGVMVQPLSSVINVFILGDKIKVTYKL
jgi:hypothetical protein